MAKPNNRLGKVGYILARAYVAVVVVEGERERELSRVTNHWEGTSHSLFNRLEREGIFSLSLSTSTSPAQCRMDAR